MMNTTLAGVPAEKWARAARAIPASTTSAMPSISKPTWVTQLKKPGIRLPFGPNGARLIANVVVPAWGH